MKRFLIFCLIFVVLALPVLADYEDDPANYVYVDGVGYVSYEDSLTYLSDDEIENGIEFPEDDVSVDDDSESVIEDTVFDDLELVGEADILDSALLENYTSSEDELQLVGISLLSAVAPVTSDDTSGLKAVLLSFIGDYDPIVAEYKYMNTNGTSYSYLRDIQPDYVWLCSCALLVLMIYCLFKLGGALLCRR